MINKFFFYVRKKNIILATIVLILTTFLRIVCRDLSEHELLRADFKNNQTTKQVNNYIWTNRTQVKFCFYLPIGPNKNCLLVLLFDCF